ncbi:MAG: tetratricopeptide repeat protein [Chloroflexi bacterium]|nr:tetratricopeptide repeat protein [Chloroflexota bacterium]
MSRWLRILILVAVLILPPLPVLWLAWPHIGPSEPSPAFLVILASYGGWLAALGAFAEFTGIPWREWFKPGPRPGAPCQAPRPLADFVGRERETMRLVKALQPGGKAAITGIVGMGGIGKTELAKVVAHQVARRFHDGVLWAECGQQELSSIADQWATVFGQEKLPGDDFPAKAAAWRGLISQKESLLIFDDVRPGQPVDELLPPSGRSAVLLTSRQSDHPALAGAARLQLDQFTSAEALALAEKVLGQAATRGQQTEATHLFELLGYLPLAVSIALTTARRNGWGLAVLNQRLAEAGALQALDEPGLRKGLAATFQTAWATLPADQQRAFATLAIFNQGPSFDTAAFAAVLGLTTIPSPTVRGERVSPPLAGEGPGERSESTATALLHRLAAASLLTPVGEDRWSLHPLLRQFVAEKLPADDPAWGRMAAHYVEVARAANELYLTKGRTMEGLALFEQEWPHIQAGQSWAAAVAVPGAKFQAEAEAQPDVERETWNLATRLCSDYPDACAHCLDLRLEPRKKIPWLEAAAAAARCLGDRQAEGAHLGNLGNVYAALGETRQAIGYYEQALAIDRESGDRRGEGADLGNLGLAYKNLGEVRRAIGYYEQNLAIAREIGDRRGEWAVMNNLGLAYAGLGEVRQAIGYYEQALAIAREIGDRRGEGAVLNNLGLAYASLGEVRRAIGYHEQALAIAREIGDRRGEGAVLNSLGLAYASLGEVRRAIGYHEQALAITREIGDRRGEGNALGNLGLAHAALGEVHRAIGFYEQHLAIAREIGHRQGEGAALGNLGVAYYVLGEVRRAIGYYEQRLAIAKETGDRLGEGNALANMGVAYKELGDLAEARRLWQEALAIFQAIEAPEAKKVQEWLAEGG